MDWIKGKLAVFETRPARKLLIISTVLTVVITLVTFAGTYFTGMINEISLIEGHVRSISPPGERAYRRNGA